MTPVPAVRGETEFQSGQFSAVLKLLEGRADLDPPELCLLGRAEFRLARYDAAELHLLRASLMGVEIAGVEYAELLHETGRSEEAKQTLEAALPHFTDLNVSRARHLLIRMMYGPESVTPGGVDLAAWQIQQVMQAVLTLSEEEEAGHCAVTLAEVNLLRGNLDRAERLLRVALTVLNTVPDPFPRGRALLLLCRSLILRGDDVGVEATLNEVHGLLELEGSARIRMEYLLVLAEQCVLRGEWENLDDQLRNAMELALSIRDHRAKGRLHLMRIEALLSTARVTSQPTATSVNSTALQRHSRVIAELSYIPLRNPQLWAAEGRAALDRLDTEQAELKLEQAREAFALTGRLLEELNVRLDLASLYAVVGRHDEMCRELLIALPSLLRLQERQAMRSLVEQYQELLERAAQDTRLAPFIQAVMDAADTLRQKVSPLWVVTLGDQQVVRHGKTLALRMAVPLLVLLHLRPGLSRRALQLALYPDRTPSAALSAVKLGIHALRRELGADAVQSSGPYRNKQYRLSGDVQLRLDTEPFAQAIWMHDISRALHLYAGPYLPFHSEGDWVQEQRNDHLAALKNLVQSRVEYFLRLNDRANAIIVCREFLQRDHDDIEVRRWLRQSEGLSTQLTDAEYSLNN